MEYDVLRPGRPQQGMVDSGPGRTDRPELGQLRAETRPPAEAHDREVREPRPLLRLVHAEPLQPSMQVSREGGAGAALVVEDDHADAVRLTVAAGSERDRTGSASCLFQLTTDRLDFTPRAMPEERVREVEVVRR